MKLLIVSMLLFAGLGGWAAPALQPGDAKVIAQFIASLARKQGGEVPDEVPRTVRSGDLNGDGVPDVAVLFTIEGPGNNYGQVLAVLVRSGGKLVALDHATVGGKLYRAVKLTSIEGGVIHLATTSYAEKDAACCPSIAGTAEYSLMDGKLKESPRR